MADDAAECELCKINNEPKYIVKTKGGNTSGLVSHLKMKHKNSDEYNAFICMENGKDDPAQIDSFLTIRSGGK